jgi:hypothetical protein
MREFDALSYFEDIARKLKDIKHTDTEKHFFRSTSASYQTELGNSGSVAKYPALVVINRKDGRFADNSSDNLVVRKLFSFQILMPAQDNNPTTIAAVMTTTEKIVKKILSRMNRDKKRDNELAIPDGITGLRGLERGSISFQQTGPLLDNLYGLYVSFSIIEPSGIKYNAEDWSE